VREVFYAAAPARYFYTRCCFADLLIGFRRMGTPFQQSPPPRPSPGKLGLTSFPGEWFPLFSALPAWLTLVTARLLKQSPAPCVFVRAWPEKSFGNSGRQLDPPAISLPRSRESPGVGQSVRERGLVPPPPFLLYIDPDD